MTTSLMSSGQNRAGAAQLRAKARRHPHDRFPLSPAPLRPTGRSTRTACRHLSLLWLVALALLLIFAGSSAAQPIAFGKNKVQ